MTLNIGLIGAGRMGKVFAHTLAFNVAEVNLLAVADANETTARQVAQQFNAPHAYADYRRLLEREDIEGVVITTPTNTHVDVVIDAARAGKQIFCEKPLSNTVAGCDRAIAAVKEAGVKLQVGFMRRFDAAYALAKQKIDEGVIGNPVMIKSLGRDPKRTSLEFARRENSGGMILDMGIHDFDVCRWLMGSEVERVYSEGGVLVYPELKDVGDIDNAMVCLRFANGALGQIDVSRNSVYGYDIRTEVLGSEGGLLIGGLQQTATLVLKPNNVSHDTIPYFMERFGAAYAAEIKDFVACIREGREPQAGGAEARAATLIGVAATLSLDESRPVLLSEIN